MTPTEERLARPFYPKMMGLHAVRIPAGLWDDLVLAGRTATLSEVQELLAPDHWRPVVMGAWFSLRYTREEIGNSLLEALERCRGDLTAPALATVAVVLEVEATRHLAAYIERDLDRQLGAAPFVAAALGRPKVPAQVAQVEPSTEAFDAMCDVARRLQRALTAS